MSRGPRLPFEEAGNSKGKNEGGSALVGEASSTCADGKGTSSVGTLAAGEDSSACAVSTVPAVVPGGASSGAL